MRELLEREGNYHADESLDGKRVDILLLIPEVSRVEAFQGAFGGRFDFLSLLLDLRLEHIKGKLFVNYYALLRK
jgi:hypothetical protein